MNMTPVKNKKSHVESFGHDPETCRCTVRYKNGGTYHYKDVPAEVHQKMEEENHEEGSIGSFLHAHIKGKFEFVRAEDEEGATS